MRKRFIITFFCLTSLLFSLFLFLNFQNREYPIPPKIKTILDKAERSRIRFDHDSAIIYLQQAQTEYRKLGKEKEAVALHGRILFIYPQGLNDNIKTHETLLKTAKTELSKLKDVEKKEAEPLIELGDFFYTSRKEEDYQKVKNIADKLIAKAIENKNWELQVGVYYILIHYEHTNKEDYNNYILVANKILSENLQEHHGKMAHLYYIYPYYLYYIYSNLADYFKAKSDYENTLIHEKKAINEALVPQIAFDSLLYHTTYSSIAGIYNRKGDFDKAREYYEYALLFAQERFTHARAYTLDYIGNTYQDQSNHEQAIIFCEQALAANHLTNTVDPANKNFRYYGIYLALAKSYTLLRQTDKAKAALDSLEKLAPEKVYEYRLLETKGLYYRLNGDVELAKKYYGQILSKNQSNKRNANIYWNLAQIDINEKKYEEALTKLQKAITLLTPDFTDTDIRSNPSFEQIRDKHLIVNYLIDKLRILRLLAKQENALETYGKSIVELSDLCIQVFETVRNSYEREGSKRRLLESAYATYESAIATYFDLFEKTKDDKHLKKAFELSERNKSVLLLDALKENTALTFGGVPKTLTEREVELTNNAAFYEQQSYWAKRDGDNSKAEMYSNYLFEARVELDSLKSLFEKKYPNYYELKYQSKYSSAEEIQQTLASDEVLISYFEGDQEIFTFCIEPSGIKAVRKTKPKNYQEEVETLRISLTDISAVSNNPQKAFESFSQNSHNFYKNYIAASIPKKAKRLFLIPDGLLSYLPFETFIQEAVSPENAMGKLPYLMLQYNISYDYSATLWASRKKRKQNIEAVEVLAMAASYEEKSSDKLSNERTRSIRNSLLPIPGTVEEIEMLSKNFKGKFLSKTEADEDNFRKNAGSYGLIHLAMHGLVDNKQPEYSGLVFSENKANKEDDFLHAYEIKSLPLNAELVVLSACETGFGKLQRGEGVASLGRSFMYAGAQSLVMTLWKLHDQSSVKLIASFYKYLSQGLPKDEALRKAKMDYIAAVQSGKSQQIAAHPAFWGCFVQLGDNRPIKIKQNSGFGWTLPIVAGSALSLLLIGLFLKNRKRAA